MTSTPEEGEPDEGPQLPPGMNMTQVKGTNVNLPSGQAPASNGISSGIGAPSNQTLAQFLNRSHVTLMIQKCFMSRDNKEDAMDVIMNACERYSWDSNKISQHVKRNLDDRLGAAWHVIVGETFSFEVTFESDFFIYVFYGSLGIVAWKCGHILLSEIKHKKIRRFGNDDDDVDD